MTSYDEGIEKINALYDGNLIKLSQMVEDGRVNSIGAKIIVKQLRNDHRSRMYLWEMVKSKLPPT